MDFIEFVKKNIRSYFIIVTGITAVMALFGGNADPGRSFGYEVFFSPLLYASIAVIPSVVFYSKKELTFRQMLLRKILHFILLEFMLLGVGLLLGVADNFSSSLSLAMFVLLVYMFTSIIQWLIDRKTMLDINNGLKKLQGGAGHV